MFRLKIRSLIFPVILVLAGVSMAQEKVDSTVTGNSKQRAEVTQHQVEAITSQLIAPCCWSETVNLHKSSASTAVQDAVTRLLQEGKTEEQIKAAMVAQYGERILATPKLEGFNYMAFILPIVALLIGGLIVWHYLSRTRQIGQKSTAIKNKTLQDYDDRIEKELQNFEN
ncbi:MAG: cytochrome c-type biogenesis protein CcmH [Deferribacteres bacterium]|nr:cytochrome c-type biogenesis protein CcmH [candidate division KSB1 bacterium]MCB9500537.1 cytochrome c-type biogenesis protein CcmH [Deferribacteres bacterium]